MKLDKQFPVEQFEAIRAIRADGTLSQQHPPPLLVARLPARKIGGGKYEIDKKLGAGCFGEAPAFRLAVSLLSRCPVLSRAVRLARGSATPEEEQDVIVFLGLSPIESTRAASLFLVYHTARAASGRLVPTHIRSLAASAARGKPAIHWRELLFARCYVQKSVRRRSVQADVHAALVYTICI